MKKRLLRILTLVLVVSLFIPGLIFGEKLKDIELSPYRKEIEKLMTDDIILGYSDQTFRPEGTITRAELTSVLTKALKLEEDKDMGSRFTDVKGKWHEGIIGAVFKEGIMVGKSKTLFAPNDKITKEEMAVLLLRAFDLEETSNELKLEIDFADNDEISSWAKNSVALAYKIELMNGITKEDKTIDFSPKTLVDRQTVAKLVYELVYNEEIYKEKANILKLEAEVNLENKEGNKEGNKEEVKEDVKKDEIPSQSDIVSRYTNELYSLQSTYQGILQSLISEAQSEYSSNKGNPNFSAIELYQKYEGIARSHESGADSAVSSLLSGLRSELESYGYDTSIVDSLQQQYEDIKGSIEIQP